MFARKIRRKPLAICSAVVAVSSTFATQLHAQSTIPYSGGTYTQNFDGLPSTGTFTLAGVGPFDLQSSPINATGMPGWSLAKFAGTGANATFFVNNGSSTSGGVYSYGVTADPERALGSLASGTVQSVIGAIFVNDSGSTLGSFTLNYTMEQWRNGGSTISNSLSFSYGVGNPNILTGAFTTVSALDATSVVNGAPAGSLNGNLPANQATVGATVSGISWLPGQTLVIRWLDPDDPGSDHGIAIDNLSFVAALAGRDLTWNPSGAGGNNWTHNPTAQNWLSGGAPTNFQVNDNAFFQDSGVGAVIVDGAGVTPGATHFQNNIGTYTIVGGSIGGNGILTKSGNGALVLSNSNTYTGGTVINGGLVIINSNESLGAAAGGVTMGGGTLRMASAVNSSRNVSLSPGSINVIDTAGHNATFSAVSGGGSLLKQGPGALTFTGAYGVTGTTSVAGGSLRLAQTAGAVNLNTGSGGADFAGDLDIVHAIRVNLNSGSFSGGGTIRTHTSGTILSTDGGQQFLTASVGNDVQLNSDGVPQPFVTTIGATINNSITFHGVISGGSDVSFASSTPGSGTGVILLNNQNTWTGTTTVNFAQAGVVRLGTNNALPPGTDLVFGTAANNAGALDLNGFDQSVKSLSSNTSGVVNGIVNTSASRGSPAVFTVTGNAVTTYSGTIGVPPNTTNLPGANDNIALVLASSHTGNLTLTAVNTYNGGTTLNGGTLSVANDNNMGAPSGALNFGGGALRTLGSISSSRAINVNVGDGRIDTNGFNSTMTGAITGAGTLAKHGLGELSVTAVNSAGLHVAQGDVKVLSNPAPNSSIGLSNIDVLVIAGGPSNPTARLDLTNNAMIVGSTPADGGPDAEAVIGAYIASGYAGGSWAGKGIASSSADRGVGQFGLGYAEAGALGISSFLGVPVLPSDSLIRFTLYGDANLDGIVNLPDFNRLAANFGTTSGGVWRRGDFNYDGVVGLPDFNRLAGNFGLSAGPDGPTPEDWAALASVVPEPATWGVIVLMGAVLLKRRRPI